MIAKNPKKSESKARKFIQAASAGNGAKRDLVAVLIKFDSAFLRRIDAATKARGFNQRTAFITGAIGEKLAAIEREDRQ